MTYKFAALRFAEDRNISDRVYWYLCDFPVKTGDRVLAPVGSRSRLQCAVVERVLTADETDAPYDLRLIKEVAAPFGARKLFADGTECFEFGGARYDEKHFTPFGKLLYSKDVPQKTEELSTYGITQVWQGDAEDPEIYELIAREKGGVLVLNKAGKKVCETLLALLKGENKYLYDIGLKRETVALLEEKLQ